MKIPLLLAEKTFRIGRQRLLYHEGEFLMEILNHTYYSRHEVPSGRVHLWVERLS